MDHGSVYRRCGCRDENTGRLLGARCPGLRDVKHGSYFSADLPAAAGERRRVRRGGFATRAAAVAALEALASHAAGPDPGLTTGEWLRRWLASRVSLRASTARSYAAHVRGYLVPYLGTIPLAALTPGDVQAMFTAVIRDETVLGRPVSAATMHRIHATLRAALNGPVRAGLIAVNPGRCPELPRAERPRAQVWTPALTEPVGAENLCHLSGCSAAHWLLGPATPVGAWDDLRLVGLKLIFLIATRAVSLLGLSRRECWWKDAEILMLRHQLAVAQRERPRAHLRLTWPDRAWLALLAGTVPAERLATMRLIVTPGTILRWHRDIVRRRWGRLSRQVRSGRPATHRNVRSVVLRLARENESWGCRRIHGELAGLGITVAPSTVWQILRNAGISPAPRRDGPGWAEFPRSQAQGILALDFFTADLLNGAKVYVLAVIEHGTRRIRILGATEHPVQSWVVQQARNLL